MSLDLYSKIEPLIEFYEEYDTLHYIYIELLKKHNIATILDVGCGNGSMLQKLKDSDYDAEGIDLSQAMTDISISKGLKAECKDISKVDKKYDAVIAIGDVLNYLTADKLDEFCNSIEHILNDGGVFIADVNTKHGFCDVAEGTMIKDFGDKFLSIDACYQDGVLSTDFVYFAQNSDGTYTKDSSTINQYFYSQKDIISSTSLKHLSTKKIKMFSTQPDKYIFIFQK
jgi:cyclopropane fatty-acyl-phospholipid synthase-like methyltransferase